MGIHQHGCDHVGVDQPLIAADSTSAAGPLPSGRIGPHGVIGVAYIGARDNGGSTWRGGGRSGAPPRDARRSDLARRVAHARQGR